jgi:hypothetical protein
LSREAKKTIIQCGEQSFQENRESFRLYFGENGAVYQNSEFYFRSWISSLTEQKKLLKNCQRTSNMPRQINYFKPKDFYKKSLRFSIVELSVKPILESPINLNSHSATTLIQQAI